MINRLDFRLRVVALLLFLVAVILYGWNSDDAYHGYIMAKHLAEGNGFVYNVGYRTTATTCPLLTLLQAFVFLFTDNPDVCGLLLGLLFSGLAAWLLLFRVCPSPATAWCLLGLMVSSHSFMSFTTAGLENSILFFLGAVFLQVYLRHPLLSKRHLLAIALLMAFLAMTRSDSVLIFIPMAVWAYLARTKTRFSVRVAIGMAGLLPFVLWTGFSVLYYGFPFPNTYYAKLHTGIPPSEYIIHGLWYYVSSWALDPMLLLVPVLFVVLAVRARNRTLVPLLLGLSIYCLYVVSIGGDFMAGRHLTQQFFLSLCGIAFLLENRTDPVRETNSSKGKAVETRSIVILAVLAGIGLAWSCFIAPTVRKQFLNLDIAYSTRRSAVDERAYYLMWEPRSASWRAILAALRGEDPRARLYQFTYPAICAAQRTGLKGVCFTDRVMKGTLVWKCADLDLFLTDNYALPDPLLSHLEVDTSRHWRIGHAERNIPKGYHQTVGSGSNCIEDPALHEFYDKLLLVMTGRIFSRERLKTILDLNRGRYDHLLAEYESRQDAAKEKSGRSLDLLDEVWTVFHSEQNAEKALDLLTRADAIDESPEFKHLSHYYRGCILEDLQGDDAAAEAEYKQALAGDWTEELIPCADRLARLKAVRGEFDSAIPIWEKAVRIDAGSSAILWNLAVAYRTADAAVAKRKTQDDGP